MKIHLIIIFAYCKRLIFSIEIITKLLHKIVILCNLHKMHKYPSIYYNEKSRIHRMRHIC